MVKTRAMATRENELLAQRGLISVEEVETLRSHFVRNPSNKIPKKKKKRKAPIGRRKVTAEMAKKFYGMKFNAGYSYDKIARMTSFRAATIHAALKRFILLGKKFTDRRKNNGKRFHAKRKLTNDAKEYLLSQSVLE
jgi:hypothetical protein